jgi:hypothetical protein
MNQIKKRFMLVFFVFLLLIGLFYTLAYVFIIESNIDTIADNELDQTRKLVYMTYFSEPTRLMDFSQNLITSDSFNKALDKENLTEISSLMQDTFTNGPEISLLVDKNSNILITNLDSNKSDFFMPQLIDKIIAEKDIISSTEIVDIDLMISYSEDLYWNSLIKEVTDYRNNQSYSDDLLVHFVLIPIFKEANIDYILVHGIILNKNQRLINTLKSYGVQSAIYAEDIVVASSFFTEQNNMYTGLSMDETIYDKVLEGEEFTTSDRFLFEEKYMGYMPLKNNQNNVVGSIAFGVDKSKYNYLSTFFGPLNIFLIALFLLLIGVGGASIMAYYFTKKFMKPMINGFNEIIEGISREEESSISEKIRK